MSELTYTNDQTQPITYRLAYGPVTDMAARDKAICIALLQLALDELQQ